MCSLVISSIMTGILLLNKVEDGKKNEIQKEYYDFDCRNDNDNSIKVCWEPIEFNETQVFLLQEHISNGHMYLTYEIRCKLKRDGVFIDNTFLSVEYVTSQINIDTSSVVSMNPLVSEFEYTNVKSKIESLNANDVLWIEVKAYVEFKPMSGAFSLTLNNTNLQLENEKRFLEMDSKKLYESCTSDEECTSPLSCVNEVCQVVIKEVSNTSVELVVNANEHVNKEPDVYLDKRIGDFLYHHKETYNDNDFHRFYFYLENQNFLSFNPNVKGIIMNPNGVNNVPLILTTPSGVMFDISSIEIVRNMLMIHITTNVEELIELLNTNNVRIDLDDVGIIDNDFINLNISQKNIASGYETNNYTDVLEHVSHCNHLRSKLHAFNQIFQYSIDCQPSVYDISDKLVYIANVSDTHYFLLHAIDGYSNTLDQRTSQYDFIAMFNDNVHDFIIECNLDRSFYFEQEASVVQDIDIEGIRFSSCIAMKGIMRVTSKYDETHDVGNTLPFVTRQIYQVLNIRNYPIYQSYYKTTDVNGIPRLILFFEQLHDNTRYPIILFDTESTIQISRTRILSDNEEYQWDLRYMPIRQINTNIIQVCMDLSIHDSQIDIETHFTIGKRYLFHTPFISEQDTISGSYELKRLHDACVLTSGSYSNRDCIWNPSSESPGNFTYIDLTFDIAPIVVDTIDHRTLCLQRGVGITGVNAEGLQQRICNEYDTRHTVFAYGADFDTYYIDYNNILEDNSYLKNFQIEDNEGNLFDIFLSEVIEKNGTPIIRIDYIPLFSVDVDPPRFMTNRRCLLKRRTDTKYPSVCEPKQDCSIDVSKGWIFPGVRNEDGTRSQVCLSNDIVSNCGVGTLIGRPASFIEAQHGGIPCKYFEGFHNPTVPCYEPCMDVPMGGECLIDEDCEYHNTNPDIQCRGTTGHNVYRCMSQNDADVECSIYGGYDQVHNVCVNSDLYPYIVRRKQHYETMYNMRSAIDENDLAEQPFANFLEIDELDHQRNEEKDDKQWIVQQIENKLRNIEYYLEEDIASQSELKNNINDDTGIKSYVDTNTETINTVLLSRPDTKYIPSNLQGISVQDTSLQSVRTSDLLSSVVGFQVQDVSSREASPQSDKINTNDVNERISDKENGFLDCNFEKEGDNLKYDWDECSRTCGGGLQTGTATLIDGPDNCLSSTSYTTQRRCNRQSCGTNCRIDTKEVDWLNCDPSSCIQMGTAVVITEPTGDGIQCSDIPDYYQIRTCINTDQCSSSSAQTDCTIHSYKWSLCEKDCGFENKVGIAQIDPIACATTPNRVLYESCEHPDCETDCTIDETKRGEWSECSVPCAGGFRTRDLTPEAIVNQPTGVSCDLNVYTEYEQCNIDPCPMDCELSTKNKQHVDECTSTCDGTRIVRSNILKQGMFGGTSCDAVDSYETSVSCNTIDCVSWVPAGTYKYINPLQNVPTSYTEIKTKTLYVSNTDSIVNSIHIGTKIVDVKNVQCTIIEMMYIESTGYFVYELDTDGTFVYSFTFTMYNKNIYGNIVGVRKLATTNQFYISMYEPVANRLGVGYAILDDNEDEFFVRGVVHQMVNASYSLLVFVVNNKNTSIALSEYNQYSMYEKTADFEIVELDLEKLKMQHHFTPQACEINTSVVEWSGVCDADCGPGKEKGVSTITQPPLSGGDSCVSLVDFVQERDCEQRSCDDYRNVSFVRYSDTNGNTGQQNLTKISPAYYATKPFLYSEYMNSVCDLTFEFTGFAKSIEITDHSTFQITYYYNSCRVLFYLQNNQTLTGRFFFNSKMESTEMWQLRYKRTTVMFRYRTGMTQSDTVQCMLSITMDGTTFTFDDLVLSTQGSQLRHDNPYFTIAFQNTYTQTNLHLVSLDVNSVAKQLAQDCVVSADKDLITWNDDCSIYCAQTGSPLGIETGTFAIQSLPLFGGADCGNRSTTRECPSIDCDDFYNLPLVDVLHTGQYELYQKSAQKLETISIKTPHVEILRENFDIRVKYKSNGYNGDFIIGMMSSGSDEPIWSFQHSPGRNVGWGRYNFKMTPHSNVNQSTRSLWYDYSLKMDFQQIQDLFVQSDIIEIVLGYRNRQTSDDSFTLYLTIINHTQQTHISYPSVDMNRIYQGTDWYTNQIQIPDANTVFYIQGNWKTENRPNGCELIDCVLKTGFDQPIDCEIDTSNVMWGDCSEMCGTGVRTGVSMITTHPSYGGLLCENVDGYIQRQECNTFSCEDMTSVPIVDFFIHGKYDPTNSFVAEASDRINASIQSYAAKSTNWTDLYKFAKAFSENYDVVYQYADTLINLSRYLHIQGNFENNHDFVNKFCEIHALLDSCSVDTIPDCESICETTGTSLHSSLKTIDVALQSSLNMNDSIVYTYTERKMNEGQLELVGSRAQYEFTSQPPLYQHHVDELKKYVDMNATFRNAEVVFQFGVWRDNNTNASLLITWNNLGNDPIVDVQFKFANNIKRSHTVRVKDFYPDVNLAAKTVEMMCSYRYNQFNDDVLRTMITIKSQEVTYSFDDIVFNHVPSAIQMEEGELVHVAYSSVGFILYSFTVRIPEIEDVNCKINPSIITWNEQCTKTCKQTAADANGVQMGYSEIIVPPEYSGAACDTLPEYVKERECDTMLCSDYENMPQIYYDGSVDSGVEYMTADTIVKGQYKLYVMDNLIYSDPFASYHVSAVKSSFDMNLSVKFKQPLDTTQTDFTIYSGLYNTDKNRNEGWFLECVPGLYSRFQFLMKGEDARKTYASQSFGHTNEDAALFDDGFHLSIQFRSKQYSTNSFTILYTVQNYSKTQNVEYEHIFYFESDAVNEINVSEEAVFFIDYVSDNYTIDEAIFDVGTIETIDCELGDTIEWEACDKVCRNGSNDASGQQKGYRVITQYPQYGGVACEDLADYETTRNCGTEECDVAQLRLFDVINTQSNSQVVLKYPSNTLDLIHSDVFSAETLGDLKNVGQINLTCKYVNEAFRVGFWNPYENYSITNRSFDVEFTDSNCSIHAHFEDDTYFTTTYNYMDEIQLDSTLFNMNIVECVIRYQKNKSKHNSFSVHLEFVKDSFTYTFPEIIWNTASPLRMAANHTFVTTMAKYSLTNLRVHVPVLDVINCKLSDDVIYTSCNQSCDDGSGQEGQQSGEKRVLQAPSYHGTQCESIDATYNAYTKECGNIPCDDSMLPLIDTMNSGRVNVSYPSATSGEQSIISDTLSSEDVDYLKSSFDIRCRFNSTTNSEGMSIEFTGSWTFEYAPERGLVQYAMQMNPVKDYGTRQKVVFYLNNMMSYVDIQALVMSDVELYLQYRNRLRTSDSFSLFFSLTNHTTNSHYDFPENIVYPNGMFGDNQIHIANDTQFACHGKWNSSMYFIHAYVQTNLMNVNQDCEVNNTKISWENNCTSSCQGGTHLGYAGIIQRPMYDGVSCEQNPNYVHEQSCNESIACNYINSLKIVDYQHDHNLDISDIKQELWSKIESLVHTYQDDGYSTNFSVAKAIATQVDYGYYDEYITNLVCDVFGILSDGHEGYNYKKWCRLKKAVGECPVSSCEDECDDVDRVVIDDQTARKSYSNNRTINKGQIQFVSYHYNDEIYGRSVTPIFNDQRAKLMNTGEFICSYKTDSDQGFECGIMHNHYTDGLTFQFNRNQIKIHIRCTNDVHVTETLEIPDFNETVFLSHLQSNEDVRVDIMYVHDLNTHILTVNISIVADRTYTVPEFTARRLTSPLNITQDSILFVKLYGNSVKRIQTFEVNIPNIPVVNCVVSDDIYWNDDCTKYCDDEMSPGTQTGYKRSITIPSHHGQTCDVVDANYVATRECEIVSCDNIDMLPLINTQGNSQLQLLTESFGAIPTTPYYYLSESMTPAHIASLKDSFEIRVRFKQLTRTNVLVGIHDYNDKESGFYFEHDTARAIGTVVFLVENDQANSPIEYKFMYNSLLLPSAIDELQYSDIEIRIIYLKDHKQANSISVFLTLINHDTNVRTDFNERVMDLVTNIVIPDTSLISVYTEWNTKVLFDTLEVRTNLSRTLQHCELHPTNVIWYGECSSSCEGYQRGYREITQRSFFGGDTCDVLYDDYMQSRYCNVDIACDTHKSLPIIHYKLDQNTGQIPMIQTRIHDNIYLESSSTIYSDQKNAMKNTGEYTCVFSMTNQTASLRMGTWGDTILSSGVCIIMHNYLIEVHVNSMNKNKTNVHVFDIVQDLPSFDTTRIASGDDIELKVNYVKNKYFMNTLLVNAHLKTGEVIYPFPEHEINNVFGEVYMNREHKIRVELLDDPGATLKEFMIQIPRVGAIDCELEDDVDWNDDCTIPCDNGSGPGVQTGKRNIRTFPTYTGKQCYDVDPAYTHQTRECATVSCDELNSLPLVDSEYDSKYSLTYPSNEESDDVPMIFSELFEKTDVVDLRQSFDIRIRFESMDQLHQRDTHLSLFDAKDEGFLFTHSPMNGCGRFEFDMAPIDVFSDKQIIEFDYTRLMSSVDFTRLIQSDIEIIIRFRNVMRGPKTFSIFLTLINHTLDTQYDFTEYIVNATIRDIDFDKNLIYLPDGCRLEAEAHWNQDIVFKSLIMNTKVVQDADCEVDVSKILWTNHCDKYCDGGTEYGYSAIVQPSMYDGSKCEDNVNYVHTRECNPESCDRYIALPVIDYNVNGKMDTTSMLSALWTLFEPIIQTHMDNGYSFNFSIAKTFGANWDQARRDVDYLMYVNGVMGIPYTSSSYVAWCRLYKATHYCEANEPYANCSNECKSDDAIYIEDAVARTPNEDIPVNQGQNTFNGKYTDVPLFNLQLGPLKEIAEIHLMYRCEKSFNVGYWDPFKSNGYGQKSFGFHWNVNGMMDSFCELYAYLENGKSVRHKYRLSYFTDLDLNTLQTNDVDIYVKYQKNKHTKNTLTVELSFRVSNVLYEFDEHTWITHASINIQENFHVCTNLPERNGYVKYLKLSVPYVQSQDCVLSDDIDWNDDCTKPCDDGSGPGKKTGQYEIITFPSHNGTQCEDIDPTYQYKEKACAEILCDSLEFLALPIIDTNNDSQLKITTNSSGQGDLVTSDPFTSAQVSQLRDSFDIRLRFEYLENGGDLSIGMWDKEAHHGWTFHHAPHRNTGWGRFAFEMDPPNTFGSQQQAWFQYNSLMTLNETKQLLTSDTELVLQYRNRLRGDDSFSVFLTIKNSSTNTQYDFPEYVVGVRTNRHYGNNQIYIGEDFKLKIRGDVICKDVHVNSNLLNVNQDCEIDSSISFYDDACSVSCDGGVKYKYNAITTRPMYDGKPCEEITGYKTEEACNTTISCEDLRTRSMIDYENNAKFDATKISSRIYYLMNPYITEYIGSGYSYNFSVAKAFSHQFYYIQDNRAFFQTVLGVFGLPSSMSSVDFETWCMLNTASNDTQNPLCGAVTTLTISDEMKTTPNNETRFTNEGQIEFKLFLSPKYDIIAKSTSRIHADQRAELLTSALFECGYKTVQSTSYAGIIMGYWDDDEDNFTSQTYLKMSSTNIMIQFVVEDKRTYFVNIPINEYYPSLDVNELVSNNTINIKWMYARGMYTINDIATSVSFTLDGEEYIFPEQVIAPTTSAPIQISKDFLIRATVYGDENVRKQLDYFSVNKPIIIPVDCELSETIIWNDNCTKRCDDGSESTGQQTGYREIEVYPQFNGKQCDEVDPTYMNHVQACSLPSCNELEFQPLLDTDGIAQYNITLSTPDSGFTIISSDVITSSDHIYDLTQSFDLRVRYTNPADNREFKCGIGTRLATQSGTYFGGTHEHGFDIHHAPHRRNARIAFYMDPPGSFDSYQQVHISLDTQLSNTQIQEIGMTGADVEFRWQYRNKYRGSDSFSVFHTLINHTTNEQFDFKEFVVNRRTNRDYLNNQIYIPINSEFYIRGNSSVDFTLTSVYLDTGLKDVVQECIIDNTKTSFEKLCSVSCGTGVHKGSYGLEQRPLYGAPCDDTLLSIEQSCTRTQPLFDDCTHYYSKPLVDYKRTDTVDEGQVQISQYEEVQYKQHWLVNAVDFEKDHYEQFKKGAHFRLGFHGNTSVQYQNPRVLISVFSEERGLSISLYKNTNRIDFVFFIDNGTVIRNSFYKNDFDAPNFDFLFSGTTVFMNWWYVHNQIDIITGLSFELQDGTVYSCPDHETTIGYKNRIDMSADKYGKYPTLKVHCDYAVDNTIEELQITIPTIDIDVIDCEFQPETQWNLDCTKTCADSTNTYFDAYQTGEMMIKHYPTYDGIQCEEINPNYEKQVRECGTIRCEDAPLFDWRGANSQVKSMMKEIKIISRWSSSSLTILSEEFSDTQLNKLKHGFEVNVRYRSINNASGNVFVIMRGIVINNNDELDHFSGPYLFYIFINKRFCAILLPSGVYQYIYFGNEIENKLLDADKEFIITFKTHTETYGVHNIDLIIIDHTHDEEHRFLNYKVYGYQFVDEVNPCVYVQSDNMGMLELKNVKITPIDLYPVDCVINPDLNLVYWSGECSANCDGGEQNGMLSVIPAKWGGSNDTCHDNLRMTSRVCNTISCDHTEKIGQFENRIDLPIYNSQQTGASLLPLFYKLVNEDGLIDRSQANSDMDLFPFNKDLFTNGFRLCFQFAFNRNEIREYVDDFDIRILDKKYHMGHEELGPAVIQMRFDPINMIFTIWIHLADKIQWQSKYEDVIDMIQSASDLDQNSADNLSANPLSNIYEFDITFKNKPEEPSLQIDCSITAVNLNFVIYDKSIKINHKIDSALNYDANTFQAFRPEFPQYRPPLRIEMRRPVHTVLYFLLDHNIGDDCVIDDTQVIWDNACDTSCTLENYESLISYGRSKIIHDVFAYGQACEERENYLHQNVCCDEFASAIPNSSNSTIQDNLLIRSKKWKITILFVTRYADSILFTNLYPTANNVKPSGLIFMEASDYTIDLSDSERDHYNDIMNESHDTYIEIGIDEFITYVFDEPVEVDAICWSLPFDPTWKKPGSQCFRLDYEDDDGNWEYYDTMGIGYNMFTINLQEYETIYKSNYIKTYFV